MTLNFAGNPALAPFIVLKQKKTLMCTSFTTQLKDSCWRETSTWLKRGGCHLLHCQRCLEIPWSFLKCAHSQTLWALGVSKTSEEYDVATDQCYVSCHFFA